MKIICDQQTLTKALNAVQKAVTNRTTMQILKGILLETNDNKLRIIATDLEIAIERYIDAEIIEEGSVVLSAKLLTEIVRKLPNSDISIEIDENNTATIKCLNSKFSIIGQSSIEYPELPTIEEENNYIIPQELFKDMIKQTVFSASIDESRPILTGVLIEFIQNNLNMVALDGFRLALRKAYIDSLKENKNVIPSKTLNEVYKIFSEEHDENINISLSDKHIVFKMTNTKVISRLLEGEFINYQQIIPENYKSRIKLKLKDLLDSIERASLLAKEGKNNLVKFKIIDKIMEITSHSELGKVQEDIFIELEGEEIEIGFNSKYFLDALKNIDEEEIYLELTSNVSPCIIRPIEGDNFIYLILPVRISS